MPRPRTQRRIRAMPRVNYFKPIGIPMTQLEEVILTIDEFEAVRLVDLEEMEQSKAAKKMNVSQPTFSRILGVAHKKIADSIINGKALRVEGGQYMLTKSIRHKRIRMI